MKLNSKGRAAKWHAEADRRHFIDVGQKPRFGRCWWFWLPRIQIGNDPERYRTIKFMWLCYWREYVFDWKIHAPDQP